MIYTSWYVLTTTNPYVPLNRSSLRLFTVAQVIVILMAHVIGLTHGYLD